MIHYSVFPMRDMANPEGPKKAYARVHRLQTLSLDDLAAHIAEHGSNYDRGDIYAVLIKAVGCLRGLVKQGYKVSLGDLGYFYPAINCEGAASVEEFTAGNIKELSMKWARPATLAHMKDSSVVFERVATKKESEELFGGGAGTVVPDGEGDSAVDPDDSTTDIPDGGTTGGGSTPGGDDDANA